MAKIGYKITKDYYTPDINPHAYMWADDGHKHSYEQISFRLVDEQSKILFVGELMNDPENKSIGMAMNWCLQKIANSLKYQQEEVFFEINIKGIWLRDI